MLQPPSLSWTLLTVCGGCAPRTIRIGYTCRNVTRPRRSTPHWHMYTKKAKLGRDGNLHNHSHRPIIPWTQDLPLTHQHDALNPVQ